jgi:hypothetical protein
MEERRAHAYNVSFRDGTLKRNGEGARLAIEKHPFAADCSFLIASRKILSLPSSSIGDQTVNSGRVPCPSR